MANAGTREQALRIVVAEDSQDIAEMLKTFLTAIGHEVVGVALNGRELVERCRELHPDLIVTDIVMPDTDGIEAAMNVYREEPIPSILVSSYTDQPFVALIEESPCIYYYLRKPLTQEELKFAITVTINRFRQFQDLSAENVKLRQSLEDRKIIERAKGIIMRRGGLDEETAYRRLQKISTDKRQKLIEIARMIVFTEECLMNLKDSP